MGGFSGTGKTTLAASLAPWLGQAPGAIHLRTDLERKRVAGVGELDRLPESAYSREARKRIYDVLYEKARSVLATGHSVIVDAVFAEQDARQAIQALARDVGAPFHGIWLHADPEKLLERVAARRNDASDVTPEVVRGQLQADPGPFSENGRLSTLEGHWPKRWGARGPQSVSPTRVLKARQNDDPQP